jgi:RNA polymerase-binding transcription factor DksA
MTAETVLLERKSELEKRLSALKKDLGKAYEQDFSEQASQRENDEVLEAIGTEAQEELKQIERALQRIANDTWNSCEKCGEDIGEKRLEAVPEATLCVGCAT